MPPLPLALQRGRAVRSQSFLAEKRQKKDFHCHHSRKNVEITTHHNPKNKLRIKNRLMICKKILIYLKVKQTFANLLMLG